MWRRETAAGDQWKAASAEHSLLKKLNAIKNDGEVDTRITELEKEKSDLWLQARLQDLDVWEMEKVKETKKGSKTYTYWMASWLENGKVKNVHLGSTKKMSRTEALEKARRLKREALGL